MDICGGINSHKTTRGNFILVANDKASTNFFIPVWLIWQQSLSYSQPTKWYYEALPQFIRP